MKKTKTLQSFNEDSNLFDSTNLKNTKAVYGGFLNYCIVSYYITKAQMKIPIVRPDTVIS